MNAPRRPLSLRGIRTFCTAARHESFRLAAEELFITASAVSHQVKKLEEELKVDLFSRKGRSIELTVAGRMLYEGANELVRGIDEVASQLRQDYRRESLRVSVQPFFASEFFVPRLNEFTTAYPEIDIQVDTSDETSERHPSSADVSIRLFRQAPSNLSCDPLFPLRLVPACSPEFRDSLDMVGWQVAKALPIVVHSGRANAWKAWSDRSGIKVPRTDNIIRLDSMIAVARAAEQGLGAALVPLPLADSWFDSGRLVRLFDYELVTPDVYCVVCENDVQDRPEIRALRDWSLQTFAAER